MTCSVCGVDAKEIIARKCRRCYSREWWKTHPRKYVKPINKNPCSVCGKSPTVAQGLCEKHYARLRRLGTTDLDKPEMWGEMITHPLYSTWNWMHSKKTSPICDEWASSFATFIRDVGERPSEKHLFRQLDKKLPFGPTNFVWYEKTPYRHKELSRNIRDSAIQRNYGIFIEDYEKMFEKQGGVCAICGNPETRCYKGKLKTLAIDHDHETGEIRGLLCSMCNTALGGFKDSPDLLLKAVEYLKANQ